MLQYNATEVEKKFQNGIFAAKIIHFYPYIHNQAQKQNNILMKRIAGPLSLTENKAQLQRWMVAGPEVAKVKNEFESVQRTNKAKDQLYDTMNRSGVSKSHPQIM